MKTGDRFWNFAIVAFVVGYGMHTVDHFRNGFGATPALVWVVGVALWVFAYWALRMVHDDSRGPLYAIVLGVAITIGFLVVHIPSYWGDGVYSMPYRGEADTLQWVALGMAVFGSVLLAVAGARELGRRRASSPAADGRGLSAAP